MNEVGDLGVIEVPWVLLHRRGSIGVTDGEEIGDASPPLFKVVLTVLTTF